MRTQTMPTQGPVGQRIQDIVVENPGIHFRALGRAAALNSTGQLRHHLDQLARRGVVSEVADGRYRRYFPSRHGVELQPHLARLSRPLPRRIVRLLTVSPLTRTALRRNLDCADSTLGYHLQRMLLQGDLHQVRLAHGVCYALADPERIRRILQAQEGVTVRASTPTFAAAAEPTIPISDGVQILPSSVVPLLVPATTALAGPVPVETP